MAKTQYIWTIEIPALDFTLKSVQLQTPDPPMYIRKGALLFRRYWRNKLYRIARYKKVTEPEPAYLFGAPELKEVPVRELFS